MTINGIWYIAKNTNAQGMQTIIFLKSFWSVFFISSEQNAMFDKYHILTANN